MQVSLSKISTVTMTVRSALAVVWTNTATVEGGKPRLLWVTPAKGGQLHGHPHRDRPGGQLLDGNGTIVVSRPLAPDLRA